MENKNLSIESAFAIALCIMFFFSPIGWLALGFYLIFILMNPLYWVYRIFRHMNIVEQDIKNRSL